MYSSCIPACLCCIWKASRQCIGETVLSLPESAYKWTCKLGSRSHCHCSHSKLLFLFSFQHLYILPVVGYHGITLTKDLCLALWPYSFPFHPLLGRQQDRRAKRLAPTKSKLVWLLYCPVCSCGTCNDLDSMSFCLKGHNLCLRNSVCPTGPCLYTDARQHVTRHIRYIMIYQMNVLE